MAKICEAHGVPDCIECYALPESARFQRGSTSVFSAARPADADDRPEAICPWCGVRIRELDIRFDPNPEVPAVVVLTFRCKNCQRFQGHQMVPMWYVVPSAITPAGFDRPESVRDLLTGLRKPKS